jgi:hypothetical protein
MKRGLVVIGFLCVMLAGSLEWTLPAQAEQQATYQLVKSNAGPGQSGSSGAYRISGSVGQPDAGQVSAGNYTLGGGFWGGGVIVPGVSPNLVYVPLVVK